MKTNKTTLLEQFQNVKIAEKDQIDNNDDACFVYKR
jgi:hypothetical protein